MRGTQTRAVTHPIVLVVDDQESRLSSIQAILEAADFLVLPASNATEALELAQSCAGPIHLLITTLHPQEMPGPYLASRLRERFPQMSVIYSSANPLAVLEIPDAKEVVSSMLPRPFTRETLLRRVKTLLACQT